MLGPSGPRPNLHPVQAPHPSDDGAPGPARRPRGSNTVRSRRWHKSPAQRLFVLAGGTHVRSCLYRSCTVSAASLPRRRHARRSRLDRSSRMARADRSLAWSLSPRFRHEPQIGQIATFVKPGEHCASRGPRRLPAFRGRPVLLGRPAGVSADAGDRARTRITS